jgi:cytochrome c oxidase assembly factor CtaG
VTVTVLLVLAAALYAWGLLRVHRSGRTFPPFAPIFFVLGLASAGAAVLGPLDDLADASLSWHMVQHLALISVAAPLLLLGAPVRLLLAALPPQGASGLARVLGSPPLRALANPLLALVQLVLVLYAAHYSPLYEAALRNENVHAAEHALFLTSALTFWASVLAVAPAPHAAPHALRILALFLALPAGAFLGFTFYVARHVLYAHYAGDAGALADQQDAGEIMWLGGGAPMFLAMLWCIADWGAREKRLALATDAAADAGADVMR